jgi:lantibiotic leader peptide-processing serine protease
MGKLVMKHAPVFGLILLLAAGPACDAPISNADTASAQARIASSSEVDANALGDRYIVVGNRHAARALNEAGFEVTHQLAEGRVLLVTGPAGTSDATLEGLAGVQHATRDIEIKLADRMFFAAGAAAEPPHAHALPELWALQWEKPLLGIPEAHGLATGAGSTIAIIDTGIQPGHPDLQNLNEAASVAFLGGQRVDDGEPLDISGHGTMVAGIAAAQGLGVLGTAPDAELVSIRVFDHEGFTTGGDILLALQYAAEIEADVANLSLGTLPLPPQVNATAMRGAVERVVNDVVRRGTVITAAGGNSAANLQHGGEWMQYPSMANTIGVSATGADDLLSFFSNYGTNAIDVAAPGGGLADPVDSYCGLYEYVFEGRIVEPGEETEICFLFPDEAFPVPVLPDDAVACFACTAPERPFPLNGIITTFYNPMTGQHGYAWEGGTSFAAPHVAGLVALVRELEPDRHPRRVADVIQQGAEDATGRSDPELGAGRINALNTLNLLDQRRP